MLRKTIILKIILLGVFASSFIFAVTKITEPKVDKFIDNMVKKHNFDENELKKILLNANYQEDVINAMTRPAESLPWYRYEKIFLQDARIKGGVKFWQENREVLERASQKYGVPPEIIVALIGVETFYGKHKGKYKVLDSLATLAFYYQPRARFFSSELEQFLLYAREEKTDPGNFYGSYAGAMGYPQFISSSIRNYAVDFNGDGHRDLHNNVDDAIGSVANYLKENGWVKGQPIATKASIKGDKYKAIDKYTNQLKTKLTMKKLKNYGITTKQVYSPKLAANLLRFDISKDNKKTDQEYWIGFNNFYVITRYNISQNYALAAFKLSEMIKEEYNSSLKKNETHSKTV